LLALHGFRRTAIHFRTEGGTALFLPLPFGVSPPHFSYTSPPLFSLPPSYFPQLRASSYVVKEFKETGVFISDSNHAPHLSQVGLTSPLPSFSFLPDPLAPEPSVRVPLPRLIQVDQLFRWAFLEGSFSIFITNVSLLPSPPCPSVNKDSFSTIESYSEFRFSFPRRTFPLPHPHAPGADFPSFFSSGNLPRPPLHDSIPVYAYQSVSFVTITIFASSVPSHRASLFFHHVLLSSPSFPFAGLAGIFKE